MYVAIVGLAINKSGRPTTMGGVNIMPDDIQMKRILYGVLILLLSTLYSKGQETNNIDSNVHKRVHNIIPRPGIGMSRHFISEFGIAYMRSSFTDHKSFGVNTSNLIFYLSVETMTPYKKPFVFGYKIGIESINVGHVTSAAGIEMGYYQRDTLSGFVITPKIGIPLVNGSLAYGMGFYVNPAMKKEIGKHRVSLTYCFNRKSDKVLHAMLNRQRKR